MKPFIRYILPLLLLLVFTNSNAQILHDRAYGTSGPDLAVDVIITSDSNYLMLGRYFKNIYLAKADTAAQPIWEKSYPRGGSLLFPTTICEIGDTSYVVSGSYQNIGFLLKINTVGDSLFSVNDSAILGANVSNLRVAPDGNLLAMVSFNGYGASLVKLDNQLNVINSITNITPAPKGMEVIGNTVYLLKKDSINNLLLINNNFNQIDTVTVPLSFPVYLKMSFDKTQLIIEGTKTNSVWSLRKRIFIDLPINIELICDSVYWVYNDFLPIDKNNNFVYMGINVDVTWGPDIRLYFADTCGQILHDTILYRPGTFSNPWREERGTKLLVNHDGNYVIYGWGEDGPLGDWDILFLIYKKWNGFPTTEIDSNNTEEPIIPTDFAIYPNPTQNQFTVSGITENSSITITDMMGKVIYQVTGTANSTQINATSWAKGIYIVQVKGTQSSTTLKVIKQ
ncbi:MAG: T9SS type A sorting domain-containing protein [Vicingaceae bacterium]|nr:T9SS type A sorting domain-containing protein [Vicingaceae bacterium]